MKIGIDASRANLEKKTGVEWYSYSLIKEIIKFASEKDFFLLYFREKPKNFNNLPKNFKIKILSPKRFWTQFRLSLEMLIHPVDLLFVPAAAIPIIHPEKTITTIHDLGFKRFKKIYPFLERLYLNFSTKFALKHCFRIIVPSEFTKRELIEIYKADEKKIFVIPHGYDQETFRVIENEEAINKVLEKYQIGTRSARALSPFGQPFLSKGLGRLGSEPIWSSPLDQGLKGCRDFDSLKSRDDKIKRPFFLYIGRLEEKKNINNLIKAFKIFKSYPIGRDYWLVLIGEKGYGYKKFQNSSIVELGYLSHQDLPYLLNVTEALVFPSLYEGFGLPILEAMACGRPVIASNIGAIKEIAQDSALLVDPKNPKEIAQAIKKITEDQFLRKYLIEKGLERVKNFSWGKCAQETLQILLS